MLLLVVAIIISGEGMILGKDFFQQNVYNQDIKHYSDFCENTFNEHLDGSTDVVKTLYSNYRDKELTKSTPISVTPVLTVFFIIHIVDWSLYQLTYKRWNMWKVMEA
jgi:hypothetical protein